ncbi:MAG: hypothetical protein SynsKO_31270 [Synoicihabitans sp.]
MDLVHFDFPTAFRKLYKKGYQLFQEGKRGADSLFDAEETAWLAANGITPQYMYDYVEDDVDEGQPGFGNALTIETVRRDYFLNVQNGVASQHVADAGSWPSKAEEIAGIRWLPRILPKARAKLRGELPASMMYCCGGDRAFFHRHNIMPAEFLALIWRHGDNDQAVVDWVKARSPAS